MTYLFLKKASQQPDLEDFCQYLKEPLLTIQEIMDKYNELPLNKKTLPENLEIYRKCDSILEKHLPRIVDTFCAFSFDYRHNEKIKIDNNTSLTAKEILLKNLGKIIEEIKLIEKEFNSNNSFETVVQTKILSKYGYQPEIIEGHLVQKDNMKLINKFNYDIFIKNKNSIKSANNKNVIIPPNKNSESLTSHTTQSSSLLSKEYKNHRTYNNDPIMQPTTVGGASVFTVVSLVIFLLIYLFIFG
jgi:hypothetical protein